MAPPHFFVDTSGRFAPYSPQTIDKKIAYVFVLDLSQSLPYIYLAAGIWSGLGESTVAKCVCVPCCTVPFVGMAHTHIPIF